MTLRPPGPDDRAVGAAHRVLGRGERTPGVRLEGASPKRRYRLATLGWAAAMPCSACAGTPRRP